MNQGYTRQVDQDADEGIAMSLVLPSHVEQILRQLPEREAAGWRTLYGELAALRRELAAGSSTRTTVLAGAT